MPRKQTINFFVLLRCITAISTTVSCFSDAESSPSALGSGTITGSMWAVFIRWARCKHFRGSRHGVNLRRPLHWLILPIRVHVYLRHVLVRGRWQIRIRYFYSCQWFVFLNLCLYTLPQMKHYNTTTIRMRIIRSAQNYSSLCILLLNIKLISSYKL